MVLAEKYSKNIEFFTVDHMVKEIDRMTKKLKYS